MENVFEKIVQHFQFYPKTDLFASRLKKQLPGFASYRPDPEATYINAFSLEWKIELCAFSPFFFNWQNYTKNNNWGKCRNINCTKLAHAALVFSLNENSHYSPILSPSRKNLLVHPALAVHPNCKKLDLLACLASGKNILTQEFRNNQLRYLQRTGAHKPLNDTNHISKKGISFVMNETKTPFARI